MRYLFADCVLDTDAVTLTVHGSSVPVQPQVVDVLALLIDERERVVSKEEILDRVWGDRFVSESALTSRIKSARQAIGDDGTTQRLIRTVHGRGYQFVGQLVASAHADVSSPVTTARVPRFASRTVGRDADVVRLEEMLASARLLTIIGPGGVGKTRLAVAVADRSVLPAVFIDLTRVRDPALVPESIADQLGLVDARADPLAATIEYCSSGPMLLVVDNVEHVIESAPQIGTLVRAADSVVVLATSREPLRVDGEVVFVLEPLTVPHEGSPVAASVVLFEQTARAVDPSFRLEVHRRSVERICSAVDGLPLAVELAASHVRTLPPEMLLPRLNERLRAPSSRRDVPDRQRTMASTIDWSLHLLDEPEWLMFMMLGALSSPAPLSIVEATVHDPRISDPVGVLGRLIDRSLVRRTLGADGSPRFGMLELLHERSFELLESSGESEVVRLRHAEAVAMTLDELREHHWRHPGAATSELIAEMLPEARAAFAFATTHEQWELAGRIVGALTVHRHRDGGQAEARAWLDMLLPHLDALSDRTRGAVLFDEGFNCWHLGDLDRAREAWADAVDAYQRLGDTVWLAYALACLSMTHVELDDDGRRRGADLAAQAIERARSVDVPAFLATVLIVCGEFARSIDDYQAARRRYEEAGRIAETVGDRTVHSVAIANLSYVASHEGNFTEARRLGRLGLELAVGAGRRVLAAWSVSELAEPALGLGELQLGARLVGAAEAALERMGGRIYPGDTPAHERVVAGLIAALGREEYDRCYAAGATLTFDQSVDVALGRQAPSDTQLS